MFIASRCTFCIAACSRKQHVQLRGAGLKSEPRRMEVSVHPPCRNIHQGFSCCSANETWSRLAADRPPSPSPTRWSQGKPNPLSSSSSTGAFLPYVFLCQLFIFGDPGLIFMKKYCYSQKRGDSSCGTGLILISQSMEIFKIVIQAS